jgi:hypothetical protein
MTQKELVDELNNSGFQNCYNYCYIPKKSLYVNQKFGFINFKSYIYAILLIMKWQNKNTYLKDYYNIKPIDIDIADIQGRNENIKLWFEKCITQNKTFHLPHGIFLYIKLNKYDEKYKVYISCNYCNKPIFNIANYSNPNFLGNIILSF